MSMYVLFVVCDQRTSEKKTTRYSHARCIMTDSQPNCILCKYQLHRKSQCLFCILIALSWFVESNRSKNNNNAIIYKLQWHEYHFKYYELELIG